LFLAQNRISNIQPNLSSSIPNLRTLVLSKNRIAELADLDPLAGFKSLVYLTLMGNPVASKEVRTTTTLILRMLARGDTAATEATGPCWLGTLAFMC
jgi:Leucine-rich repeat (LRR) protein